MAIQRRCVATEMCLEFREGHAALSASAAGALLWTESLVEVSAVAALTRRRELCLDVEVEEMRLLRLSAVAPRASDKGVRQ